MIRDKKTASISGLTEVLEFFSRARMCDAANLAKMSMESNSFPAALALCSWDKMVKIWLQDVGVTMSFFLFFMLSLVSLGLFVDSVIARDGGFMSWQLLLKHPGGGLLALWEMYPFWFSGSVS